MNSKELDEKIKIILGENYELSPKHDWSVLTAFTGWKTYLLRIQEVNKPESEFKFRSEIDPKVDLSDEQIYTTMLTQIKDTITAENLNGFLP